MLTLLFVCLFVFVTILYLQGDCDSDDDCEGNLVCFQTEKVKTVPGCKGVAGEDIDYCHEKPKDDTPIYGELIMAGDDGLPKSAFPLGPCEVRRYQLAKCMQTCMHSEQCRKRSTGKTQY